MLEFKLTDVSKRGRSIAGCDIAAFIIKMSRVHFQIILI